MTQLHRAETNASRALTDRKRARNLRRRGRYDDMLDGDKDPSSAQRRHGRAVVAAEVAGLAPRFRTLTDDEVASIRDEARAWRSAIGERFAAIERRP